MTMLMLLLILFISLALNHSFVNPRSFSKPPAIVRQKYNQHEFVIEEWRDDLNKVVSSFSFNHTNKTSKVPSIPSSSVSKLRFRCIGSLASLLRQTFLPAGFPNSVPNEYLHFQAWNLLQDLCSYLRGIMSTRAILLGMGVGRSDVTAVQATIQWIVRDGASLIGGLLLTAFNSYDFGQNVKKWRMFADMINNVGITLNMLAPLSPKLFLPLLCLGSVCTTLCSIAAGSTNAAINTHWGQNNNIADVLAKNNAQHTLISLVGLLVSIPFAHFAENVPSHIMWIIYSCLTCIHIGSNYRALRILTLTSINSSRYELLLSRFLSLPRITHIIHNNDIDTIDMIDMKYVEVNSDNSSSSPLLMMSLLLSPTAIAKAEPIIRQFLPSLLQRAGTRDYTAVVVKRWSKLTATSAAAAVAINKLKTTEKKKHIITCCCCNTSGKKKNETVIIELSFHHKSTFMDHAKGYLEAEILRSLLLSSQTINHHDLLEAMEQKAEQLTDKLFPLFIAQLKQAGWKEDISNLKPARASTYKIIMIQRGQGQRQGT